MINNQEVWFIVNFFSGVNTPKKKAQILDEINKFPNSKILFTNYPKHATELAKSAVDSKIEIVVAVGGDGTINEISSVLQGSKAALGIVPIGSGNGLARHLKIPMLAKEAINNLFNAKILEIDTCSVNNIPFFCTAGVGFDAFVANNFSKKKSRGFLTYIITTIQSFFTFKPIDFDVFNGGFKSSFHAFAITFANASQYGNDAVVAPESKIDDGLLDMVVLTPFSLINSFSVGWRLFNNSFSKSKYVETIKGDSFTLATKNNCLIHFDGEPKQLETNELVFKIESNKLKVLV